MSRSIESEIGLIGVSTGSFQRLLSMATVDEVITDVSLSPSGQLIAYRTQPRNGASYAIRVARIDGAGRRTLLTGSGYGPELASWSPDSTSFLVTSAFSAQQLILLSADGNSSLDLITNSIAIESADFSPDGKRIAVTEWVEELSNGWLTEVFVIQADGTQKRSLGRGLGNARWRPN